VLHAASRRSDPSPVVMITDWTKRRVVVTGAAGFIGSHLTERLLSAGAQVVGYDNFSTGIDEFLAPARSHPAFSFIEGDVLDSDRLADAMQGADTVFHLAANADVRRGLDHPHKDLEQNTIATFKVLEAMRTTAVKNLAFASTGSIYGEATVTPTPEDAPFPVQTSLYGASKLAAEGMIAAYCEGYGMRAWIFRFVSILGERYTHGHVLDFYNKLLADPLRLHVLGDGHQRKSYLYVHDCIDGILCAIGRGADKVNVFNLGTDHCCEVMDSVRWITTYLRLAPVVDYAGGRRGWIGDNPLIWLDTRRIRALGWEPTLTIEQSLIRTIAWLVENPRVLASRG
jgi:UDP-glucose 4-epimerase